MAAFKKTFLVTPWANSPSIVQRFLSTSARSLFHPTAAIASRAQSPSERLTPERAAS
jgi:hypothetical protein